MTAPTSPGVVPADVQLLAAEAAVDLAYSGNGTNYKLTRAKIEAVVMADRANRPSLTEAERGQVRREALEEAALTVAFQEECERTCYRIGMSIGNKWTADMLGVCVNRIRALADRSEPLQEKEGDRG